MMEDLGGLFIMPFYTNGINYDISIKKTLFLKEFSFGADKKWQL